MDKLLLSFAGIYAVAVYLLKMGIYKKKIADIEKEHQSIIIDKIILFSFSLAILEILVYEAFKKYNLNIKAFYVLFAISIIMMSYALKKYKKHISYQIKIRANILSNFDEPIKKKNLFEKEIKSELPMIEKEYYFNKSLSIKYDKTIENIKLNKTQFLKLAIFENQIKDDEIFDLNDKVNNFIIDYFNQFGDKYEDLGFIDKENCQDVTRIEVEKAIFQAYKRLVDKDIAIRIAQLLQLVSDSRQREFINFLLCITNNKFNNIAIIYAMYFAKIGLLK